MRDASQDIVFAGAEERPWLVVGWFTPDYRPLALDFAENLHLQGAPFHLYAKRKLAPGWNTKRKPAVALQAMHDYPGRAVVLMDVDCVVSGDLTPATQIDTDVALRLKPRQGRKSRLILTASSRVVVFGPTPGARAFAETWRELCERSPAPNDEPSLVWAYVNCRGSTFSQLDDSYVGRESDVAAEGAVVYHRSVHDAVRRASLGGAVSAFVKGLEKRWLRSTRRVTRAAPES